MSASTSSHAASRSPHRPAVRLLIAAGSGLFREGLGRMLGRRGHLRVVGSADGLPALQGALAAQAPDVVLVDTAMPGSDEIIQAVAGGEPTAKIVVLTPPEPNGALGACAEARVTGYVSVDESADVLAETIEGVARGELRCSPRTAGDLLELMAGGGGIDAGRPPRAAEARLTRREREIVELIAEGRSNKEIAQRLWIELPTVKNHVHSILRKLQVATRGEAVARLRTGPAQAGSA